MSTKATATPSANAVPIADGSGTLNPLWVLGPISPPPILATLSTAWNLGVASAANPATELGAIGGTEGEWRCVYQAAAGTDAVTWYRLDTTSAATNAPYVVASLTAGMKWVAVWGRYQANPLSIVGALTVSTLTATRVPFAGVGGLLGDDGNFTYASGALRLSNAAAAHEFDGIVSFGGTGAAHSIVVIGQSNPITLQTVQKGLSVNMTGETSGTAELTGIRTQMATATAAYTVTNVNGQWITSNLKGAGSTITYNVGVNVGPQTVGTNNACVYIGNSNPTGNWALYVDSGVNESRIASTTDASSAATGCLTLLGGMGIAKSLWIGGTTSSSSSIAGTVVIGNGTATTTMAFGGGQINAGGSIHKFGAPSTGYAALSQNAGYGRFTCQDVSGAFAADFLVLSSTNAAVRAVTSAAVSLNPNNGVEALRASVAGNLLVGTTADTGITGSGGLHTSNTTDASAIGTAANIFDGGASVAKRSFLGTIGSTFKGNVLAGVQDGTAAVSGQVGEVISATASAYTNYTTTATNQQITTVSLTPGDWDIKWFGTISANGSTLTLTANAIFALSTTTASTAGTTEGSGDIGYISQVLNATSGKDSISGFKRANISTTTSYFLNSQATFTVGNPQFVGSIVATRVR